METQISILYPNSVNKNEYTLMSDTSWHDLGMDLICKEVSSKEGERQIIRSVLKNMSSNPLVSNYRIEVFEDLYKNPDLQKEIMDILEQVNQLQDFMSLKRNIDKTDGIWTLMRRLKEVKEYAFCVERLEACLKKVELKSQGMKELQQYVHSIQEDPAFSMLKKDIDSLQFETKKVKSVTLGVNLNEDYEAVSMGIVSLNEKQFSHSNLLNQFHQHFSKTNSIQKEAEWNNQYSYQIVSEKENPVISPFEKNVRVFTSAMNPLMGVGIGLSKVTNQQPESNLLDYLSQVANRMLSSSVKNLKDVLAKYATVSIFSISGLMFEFNYYLLWTKYIHRLEEQGYSFSKAEIINKQESMICKDVYNLKLASLSKMNPKEIIGNDLDFSDAHTLYVLTGANRGGKTTITQAIGQLYILAQGGIYVPASSFQFEPVDGIFTHFPADEDKTLDYGRLGEECQRFKEIYDTCSNKSLILLNESFSTTSFEEGYYIAKDAIRAILIKGTKTIFNTHMHKLAQEIEMFNEGKNKAVSLIVESENGQRSYKVRIAPTTGISMASDIARKYGVTFDQLVNK